MDVSLTTMLLAGAATGTELASYAAYVGDIRRGRARPSRASWMIWAPLGWLIALSNWEAGAVVTMAKLLVMAAGVTCVAALSLRYGTGGRSTSDLACFAATAAGVLAWSFTREPAAGLAMFLIADLAAATPTLRDLIRDPLKDSRRAWTLAFVASVLNVLSVETAHWQASWAAFGVWGYALYLVALNAAVVALMWRRVPAPAPA